MKKDKEFNSILDECLERLLVKAETIEQCLASYPEQAAELEPLLQTMAATRKALAIQPDPEFKARARYQLQSALREVKTGRGLFSFFNWQPRWVVVVVPVLVLLLAGGGTGAVAGSSMPDNPLYSVKLATEQVQLRLASSGIDKAELHAKLADRRVAEIVNLADKDEPQKIEQTAERLNEHLVMIASQPLAEKADTSSGSIAPGSGRAKTSPGEQEITVPMLEALAPPSPQLAESGTGAALAEPGPPAKPGPQSRLRNLVKNNAANNQAALQGALKTAGKSAKPALLKAIEESADNYKKALESLD